MLLGAHGARNYNKIGLLILCSFDSCKLCTPRVWHLWVGYVWVPVSVYEVKDCCRGICGISTKARNNKMPPSTYYTNTAHIAALIGPKHNKPFADFCLVIFNTTERRQKRSFFLFLIAIAKKKLCVCYTMYIATINPYVMRHTTNNPPYMVGLHI